MIANEIVGLINRSWTYWTLALGGRGGRNVIDQCRQGIGEASHHDPFWSPQFEKDVLDPKTLHSEPYHQVL